MKFAASLLLLLSCAVAHAQSTPSTPPEPKKTCESCSTQAAVGARADSVIITGELDQVSAADGGGGGSLDWVRSTGKGRTLNAGLVSFSMAGSHWTFGRAGASFRPLNKVTAHGQASLGAGRAKDSFTYLLFDGGLSYKASTRIYLNLADQYMHVATTHGNLLKTGASFLPVHHVSVDLAYARSLGGNLNTEFLSGRLDFRAKHAGFLGGFAVGRSATQVFNLGVGSREADQDLKDGFVGLVVPFSRSEFSVVSDFLNLGTVRRRTFTFSLKFPIGGR